LVASTTFAPVAGRANERFERLRLPGAIGGANHGPILAGRERSTLSSTPGTSRERGRRRAPLRSRTCRRRPRPRRLKSLGRRRRRCRADPPRCWPRLSRRLLYWSRKGGRRIGRSARWTSAPYQATACKRKPLLGMR
jgi:hypothetical protein